MAERLRKAGVYTVVGKREDGLTLEWNVALMSELAEAVGLRDDAGIEVFDRLADLIEPSCDREALLSLADEIEANDVCYGVSEQYVRDEYARRIREACGVVA